MSINHNVWLVNMIIHKSSQFLVTWMSIDLLWMKNIYILNDDFDFLGKDSLNEKYPILVNDQILESKYMMVINFLKNRN